MFPLSYRREPRVRRRRTMSCWDGLFLSRVRPSGWPQGDTGWRPPEVLPSPPPWGWSTGFMATPRVWGRTPFQRLRPALPILMSSCSELPDLADRGAAVDRHASHLGGREAQGGEVALLGHELDAGTGRAGHLAAGAGLELDVVHHGADGDVAHRQGVAGTDVRALAGHQLVADVHVLGGEDVALLAVVVVQQGDAAGAVGVVLDRRDRRRDAVLVPLEVDDAVLLLVAATAMAGRLAAVVVAATGAALLGEQRLLGLVGR